VRFLIQTDPLALVLSVAWILLGVVAYVALNRYRESPESSITGVGEAGDLGEAGEVGETSTGLADEDGQTGAGPDAGPAADEDD
jgi:hypothetical protein